MFTAGASICSSGTRRNRLCPLRGSRRRRATPSGTQRNPTPGRGPSAFFPGGMWIIAGSFEAARGQQTAFTLVRDLESSRRARDGMPRRVPEAESRRDDRASVGRRRALGKDAHQVPRGPGSARRWRDRGASGKRGYTPLRLGCADMTAGAEVGRVGGGVGVPERVLPSR
jgi:hypothetical protein